MIVIGGIGGSGTRLVSTLLNSLNYYLGNDLNDAKDNLLFSYLFRYKGIFSLSNIQLKKRIDIFLKILNKYKLTDEEKNYLITIKEYHKTDRPKEWFDKKLLKIFEYLDLMNQQILMNAWKAPSSHLFIKDLLEVDSKLKYIYVYRDGLDMSHSKNLNQLKLWGETVYNFKNSELNPHFALKYWCQTNKRMLEISKEYPNRILLLNFDKLCLKPEEELKNFLSFLSKKNNDLTSLRNLIKVPGSIGRHKNINYSLYDTSDIEFYHNFKNKFNS